MKSAVKLLISVLAVAIVLSVGANQHISADTADGGQIFSFSPTERSDASFVYDSNTGIEAAKTDALNTTVNVLVLKPGKTDLSTLVNESIEVTWEQTEAVVSDETTGVGIYYFNANPVSNLYTIYPDRQLKRMIIIDKPAEMRLMSRLTGAVLTKDKNGKNYSYDTTFCWYTGQCTTGGSRELFYAADRNALYYCSVCQNYWNYGGTTCSCNAENTWMRGISVSGQYYYHYHRHHPSIQFGENGHMIYSFVENSTYTWQRSLYDTEAPTAPAMTPSTVTTSANWTQDTVTLSIGGSTDSGWALSATASSPNQNGKGVSHYEYSLSNSEWVGVPEGQNGSLTFNQSGNYEVTSRAIDKGKLVSTVAVANVYVDKTVPTLSLTPSSTDPGQPYVNITIAAGDVHSGISKIEVNGSEAYSNASTQETTHDYIYNATENGTYTVTVTDHVGLSTTQQIVIDNICQGQVVIAKKSTLSGELLSGAVYGIYKLPAETLVETVKTGSSGKATSSMLTMGDYYLLEQTAPARYYISAKKTYFSITTNGVVLSETVADPPVLGVMYAANDTAQTKAQYVTGYEAIAAAGLGGFVK